MRLPGSRLIANISRRPTVLASYREISASATVAFSETTDFGLAPHLLSYRVRAHEQTAEQHASSSR
jgi:hypothetical protein